VDAPAGGIAADALAPRRVGELVFPLTEAFVADVVLVADEAIRQAQQRLWQALRTIVEPAAAVGLAALLTGAYRPEPGETVAVVLSGANTSLPPAGLGLTSTQRAHGTQRHVAAHNAQPGWSGTALCAVRSACRGSRDYVVR